MKIEIQLTRSPIAEKVCRPPLAGAQGAWLEFRGVVRGEEDGRVISGLEYEAYPGMTESEIRRILESLAARHPCLAVKIIHRLGVIGVGETAVYAGISGTHRGEAIALLTEFMHRLKLDVPIWKVRALYIEDEDQKSHASSQAVGIHDCKPLSFEESFSKVYSHLKPLPAVRTYLAETFGRVLRETVCATEDLPAYDHSTRDGYAILQNDSSDIFQVVDTLHAGDWKPRQLKSGEAVRVATGAVLPDDNLRVVMQENVERSGDKIKIVQPDGATNVRKRGEEIHAGEVVLPANATLNAGAVALLAAVGCTQPLVSPRLRVQHFTTGDEIVPPEQTPKLGQIRDCNSVLIRGLLQKFSCELTQSHLHENLETAKSQTSHFKSQLQNADVLLISGGASVGDKDFTVELLASMGFEIVFSRLNIRPGAPLIFGVNGPRIAFGLPGNPVSHFVCFHLFVVAAFKRLTGAEPQSFLQGVLASKLDDVPNSRESFLPARWDDIGLHPLKWLSSGDVKCLRETNALIRIPASSSPMEAGMKVDFFPV
jgi:molybdopterin molybdotransferase